MHFTNITKLHQTLQPCGHAGPHYNVTKMAQPLPSWPFSLSGTIEEAIIILLLKIKDD